MKLRDVLIGIFVFALMLSISPLFAANIEGTGAYDNYIFILVHGINNTSDIFEGKTPYGNLKNFLEKDMGLKGRLFDYTFTDNVGKVPLDNGSYNSVNKQDARELGDRNYKPSPNSTCWLEQAKEDFASSHKQGTKIPSKYIILSYSMGNLAVRSYIYSDSVFGGKGFYQNDIEKVVFIAPPMLGSDMTVGIAGFWVQAIKKFLEGNEKLSENEKDANGNVKGLYSALRRSGIGGFEITDFHYEWALKIAHNIA